MGANAMIHVPSQVATARRPGAVLLVVMAMLALFAAVGLSFVYYADSESTASRYFRQSVGPTRPEVAPELLLGYFLNQLIFDTNDKYSAMRGHSLARTMYGYKTGGPNNVPFNGAGRLSFTSFAGKDNINLINYTDYGFSRDPEIYGGTYIGCNVNWTYPDLQNVMLAAINANGEVLIQSGHRPWTGGLFDPDYPKDRIGNPNPDYNQSWTRYMTLRPHPSYHTLFPAPEDRGGDVKNLEFARGVKYGPGQYDNNDSFWMDLGFGILTDPTTGKKYKPLFAPLVIDLDGRVNLNAAGSLKHSLLPPQGSNHGLGPWEINISQVMGADWVNLFSGFGGVAGRYGANNLPAGGGAFAALGAGAGQTYSSTDMDGMGTLPYQLPGKGAPALSLYPQFDPGTYGNGGAGEQNNHPGLYNSLIKTADDRVIEARHMEFLLRYGGTGAHALTSDLTRLCKDSFLTGGSADKWRRLVTTHSFDLGRAGIAPWLYPGSSTYTMGPGGYPTGPAAGLPAPAAWPANQGEYDGNGRGYILPPELPNLPGPRLNINRTLPDYPVPAGNNVITDMAGFSAAQDARQKLAKDLFNCLRLVCTGARPTDAFPAKGTPEYLATRWLAQLAVNIVDYRDRDDYATPFNWDTSDPTDPNNWVFGVEPAPVVINEVYAEVGNDPTDPGPMDKKILKATKDFKCKFWVELSNPTKGTHRLHNPAAGFPVYKVQIAIPGKLFTESQPGVPDALGTPEPLNTKLEVADYVPEDPPTPQPPATVDVNLIRPDSNGDYSGTPGDNELLYVLGSKYDFPGANQATLRVKEQNIGGIQSAMCYNMDIKNTDLTKLPQHNVFLRRLACPHLPPQVSPGPNYNPYVTVDYVEGIVTYDGVDFDKDGMNKGVVPADNRVAKGRRQPHDANLDNQAAVGGEPDHTFFKQNSNNKSPFDWLTHLDRALMSPIEILQVSAVKPFELTHKFVVAGTPHQHIAPWSINDARIYRLLEFLDCGWRANGVSQDGRIPGKVNINTIWDVETFRALCDKNGVSSYSDNVDDIFNKLMLSRTTGGVPTVNDRPFRGLSVGNTGLPSSGQGVGDTLLRSGVFDVIPANGMNHPYQKKELLSKIFNNVTTRSNVFAVWVTVGFFEVVDDSVKPAKLGAEIGRAQGRHVRHRMFAIIDRTKLEIAPGFPGNLLGPLPVPGNPGPLPWPYLPPWWTSPLKDRFNMREHPALVPYYTVIE